MSLLFLFAAANALNTSTSLEVVSEYTTFLESATELVEGNKTYTVTGPTTLTVTDCPCTRTHTYTTQYVTACSASAVETVAPSSGGVASNGAVALAGGLVAAVLPLLL